MLNTTQKIAFCAESKYVRAKLNSAKTPGGAQGKLLNILKEDANSENPQEEVLKTLKYAERKGNQMPERKRKIGAAICSYVKSLQESLLNTPNGLENFIKEHRIKGHRA